MSEFFVQSFENKCNDITSVATLVLDHVHIRQLSVNCSATMFAVCSEHPGVLNMSTIPLLENYVQMWICFSIEVVFECTARKLTVRACDKCVLGGHLKTIRPKRALILKEWHWFYMYCTKTGLHCDFRRRLEGLRNGKVDLDSCWISSPMVWRELSCVESNKIAIGLLERS